MEALHLYNEWNCRLRKRATTPSVVQLSSDIASCMGKPGNIHQGVIASGLMQEHLRSWDKTHMHMYEAFTHVCRVIETSADDPLYGILEDYMKLYSYETYGRRNHPIRNILLDIVQGKRDVVDDRYNPLCFLCLGLSSEEIIRLLNVCADLTMAMDIYLYSLVDMHVANAGNLFQKCIL